MHNNSRRKFIASIATGAAALTLTPALSFAGNPAFKPGIADPKKMVLGMVVFDGFQLLDTFGPLEMFGSLRDKVSIIMLGEKSGSVKSSAGPAVMIDHTFEDAPELDILMIPGGGGTRREVKNITFVESFRKLAIEAPM